MIGKAEHELHVRRKGRNYWLGGILLALVVLVFAVTMVKLKRGQMIEGFDHTLRPSITEPAE